MKLLSTVVIRCIADVSEAAQAHRALVRAHHIAFRWLPMMGGPHVRAALLVPVEELQADPARKGPSRMLVDAGEMGAIDVKKGGKRLGVAPLN